MSGTTSARTSAPVSAAAQRGRAGAAGTQAFASSFSSSAVEMQRSVGNTALRGLVQRMCAECAKGGATCDHCHEEEEAHVARMQRAVAAPGAAAQPTSAPSASGAVGSTVPSTVRGVLSQTGSPLPSAVRATMEAGFGQSFAGVRVHTGAAAAQSAADVGALAYTVGGHIVFGAGHFAPETARGSHLLAHELTHVVQQRYARIDLDKLALDDGPMSAPEREADAMAARVVAGDSARLSPLGDPNLLQRRMVEDEAAGGCGLCLGPQAAGTQAHRELQMQFLVDLRREGFTRVVEHYVQGAPGDENGFLDLAAFDKSGNIYIGEIKPANSEQLEQGHNDIDFYTRQIIREHGITPRPLRVPIDTRVLVFPNPGVMCEGLPQLIELNPPTPDGVYTYYCTPTRNELWRDPECRCWPKRKRKKKEKEKEKDKEKDKGKKKPIDVKPYPPPVIIDGPGEVDQPRPGDSQEKSPEDTVDEDPVEDPKGEEKQGDEKGDGKGESEGDGKSEGEGDGKSEGEGDGKSDGKGDGEGGGKGDGWGDDYGIFPGRVPPGHGIPRPSPEAVANAARIAVAAMIVAAVVKFGGKRILAPLTAAATLILLANGAKAEISLKGDDPIKALIESGGKKGIKISPELEKAIRDDPRIMESLRKAAASGDLSKAQQELSAMLTETITKNADQFTDAELAELAKITDPKNGASIAGDATVAEIKRMIAAHKAGARPAGPSSGSGGGASGGKKSPRAKKLPASPPVSSPKAAQGGAGQTSGKGVPAPAEKGEGKAPPGDVAAPKDAVKGSGGAGGAAQGDSTAAKGPAVSLPAATTPATKLLNAWAQGGTGPKLDEAAKKRFLDWASSVSPPLTDAEVEKLAPMFEGNRDKTIDQTLDSVQAGLAALRSKKETPPVSTSGDEDTKGAGDPSKSGGAVTTKKLPPPKKPVVGKDAKKVAPAPAGNVSAKEKPMSADEIEIGKHIAKFLSTVNIGEDHARWVLDENSTLVADPGGKTAVGAWMYGRANGKLFMAAVTLHPTAKTGKVWSFHIDGGASIYDSRGIIVGKSSAIDTQGILSDE